MLVVGASADRMAAQLGGWSLTWQGDETDNSDYPLADTALSAIRKTVSGGGKVDYSTDGSGVDVKNYDAVTDDAS